MSEQKASLELVPISEAPVGWEPDWIIENIWQQNGLNLVVGPPKRGRKSSLRRYFTACALTGEPAFGRFKTNKVERMLSLIVEDHCGRERDAVCKAISALGYDVDPIIKQDRLVYGTSAFINITETKWRNALREELNAKQYDFVTMDPLIEFHHADENSAKEMGEVVRILRWLAAKAGLGATHHTGKGKIIDSFSDDQRTTGERMRGSTVLPGAANVTILTTAHNKSPILNQLEFEIKTPAEGGEPDTLVVKPNWETWLWTARDDFSDQKVLDFVSLHEGTTRKKIARHFNVKDEKVTELVQKLVDGGQLLDNGHKRGLSCP